MTRQQILIKSAVIYWPAVDFSFLERLAARRNTSTTHPSQAGALLRC